MFAALVTRSVPLSLVVFFLFGIAAELLLFDNIGSMMDLPGMLFFGTLSLFVRHADLDCKEN
ncbi:MAG: hypothetical protein NTY71_06710 [Methanoregula sp.]|nr:hypothetical protein [Methanoregula sp.]